MNSIDITKMEKYLVSNVNLQLDRASQNKSCAALYISGPAGIGKTEILSQICQKYGWGLSAKHMS